MNDWIKQHLALPHFEDENVARSASLLNTILLFMLAVTAVYAASSTITRTDPLPLLIGSAILTPLWLLGLFLIRRGKVRIAALGVVSFMWLMVTVVSILNGGVGSVTLVNYCLLIVIAALTLGGLYGLVFAAASVLASLGMLVGGVNGLMPPATISQTLASSWMILTVNLVAIASLLYLASSHIRDSLERAWSSEKALARSNRELGAEIAERIHAEEKLQENELRYRALFERTNDAVFILSLDGVHLAVNHQAAELLGYSEAELVGMPVEQVVVPHQYSDSRTKLAALQAGESLPVYERVFCRKNGSELAAEMNVATVYDAEGNPLHIQSVVRDITERKRAEDVLRQERDLLQALMDNVPDTIYFKDTDSKFTRINPAQVKLLGLSDPAEAVGKTDFDFFVEEHAQLTFDAEQQIVQSGQPLIDHVERLTGIDGRTCWVTATKIPLFDQEKQVVGLVGISRDISERVEAEGALRESEERFRGVFENSVMGLYRTTPDGHILMANPALVNMLGYSSLEELVQRNLEESGYAAQYPRSVFKERIERDGEVVGLESAWIRSDGATVHIRESAKAVCDSDGDFLYYEGTVEDITDRVLAESALRDSEARYRSLFQESPISLWEEDFSKVKRYLDELREAGPLDLREYLFEHPETLEHCVGLVEIVDVNQETVELYRAGSKERLYQGLDKVLTPESLDAFREELLALTQGKMRFEREVVQQTLTGETLHAVLRLVVAPGYEETWGKVFVSILDITARLRVEAERERLLVDLMRRSNQLLTATDVSKSTSTILVPEELIEETVNLIQERFDFYYVGLFLVDEVGEYAVLHAGTGQAGQSMLKSGHRLAVGGESMIGWSTSKAQARIALDTGTEAVHFENPYLPETRSEMALPLISRGQCIGALTVQSKDESAFSAGDIASLQSMADQLATALANARLYDEVQRYAVSLEERVAERTAELSAVNKELEAFAYSVSHDLRAPLRSIDGFGQALLEDYEDALDNVGKDYLRRVRAGSQRMGRLIDDLLRLSRFTRREMHLEEVDLSAMAQAIAHNLGQNESQRDVEFVLANNVIVEGDRHLLEIALENLLANAWKFTSLHDRARIEFGVMVEAGQDVYFVRDDGAGFDMAYVDKLFGAFQRLHAMTEFEGSGIGLATAQRIVHRHGGRMWAEGAVEQGATFYFTLAAKGKERD